MSDLVPVLISVTKNDIRKGVQKCGFDCAFALAIQRRTKVFTKIKVGIHTCLVTGVIKGSEIRQDIEMPKVAGEWIERWDMSRRGMKPIRVTLNLPKWAVLA